jgi:hypothetical protein
LVGENCENIQQNPTYAKSIKKRGHVAVKKLYLRRMKSTFFGIFGVFNFECVFMLSRKLKYHTQEKNKNMLEIFFCVFMGFSLE